MKHTKRLQATAYHEAGHAMMAYIKNMAIRRVSIIPNEEEGSLGHCLHGSWPKLLGSEEGCFDFIDDQKHRDKRETLAMMMYGGLVAEKHFTGRYNWIGAGADRSRAADLLASSLSGDLKEWGAYINWIMEHTRVHLNFPRNWAGVEALATALLQKGQLNGRQAKTVIKAGVDEWKTSLSSKR